MIKIHIKDKGSPKVIYINDNMITAIFYKLNNKLDMYNGAIIVNTYSSANAKLIKENLDALCERQCPKCYSGAYYVSFTESNGEYRWVCVYCKSKSPKSKVSPKQAYDEWWSDAEVDEVEFDWFDIYIAYEDIKKGDIVCLFKEDGGKLWKGIPLCDAVLPLEIMYPLESYTNIFNASSNTRISGEYISKDTPCVISEKDGKLYAIYETNEVSTLDGE